MNLHYGSQGTDSSSISMQRNPSSSSTTTTAAPARRASSTEDSGSITNLPGPRQITTHPGVSGTNPLTGERQRRRGVSGPPSGLFLTIFSNIFLVLVYFLNLPSYVVSV